MFWVPPLAPRDDRPAGDRCDVTLRDTFAAAAFPCCHEEIYREGQLKGYAADWREQIVRQAYAYADAMLRERERVTEPLPKEKRAEVSYANHGAAPAAKAITCEDSRPQAAAASGNLGSASNAGSTGSTQEPVAWAVRKWNPPVGELPAVCWTETEMRYEENRNPRCTVIPLYRSPTLTAEERKAANRAAAVADEFHDARLAVTLRALLERTK